MMHNGKKFTRDGSAEVIRAANPAEAEATQEMLRLHCRTQRSIDAAEIRHVAGADAAYSRESIHAAVVVMTFPELAVAEKTCTVQKIPFPYIPGLLSFREGPAIVEAYSRLSTVPDLLLVNGHGYAHPKRIGIASHIGIILGVPSVGVAQRLLTGNVALPGKERGSIEPVLDNDEIIGMAVRTVTDAKPVFVSAGHRVDLALAVDLALKLTGTHRLTEPIWHADRLARECRHENFPCK